MTPAFLFSAFPARFFNVHFSGYTGVGFLQFRVSGEGFPAFGARIGFREFVGFCAVLDGAGVTGDPQPRSAQLNAVDILLRADGFPTVPEE